MKKKALIRSLGRRPSEDRLALYVRKASQDEEKKEKTAVEGEKNRATSLPPEKPRGTLTKIRNLPKDLTKGLRKDLSAPSSTIVKLRNSKIKPPHMTNFSDER